MGQKKVSFVDSDWSATKQAILGTSQDTYRKLVRSHTAFNSAHLLDEYNAHDKVRHAHGDERRCEASPKCPIEDTIAIKQHVFFPMHAPSG